MPKEKYVPKNFSRDDLIYLASMVDGEGALVISRHSSNHKRGYNYQVRLEISNTIEKLPRWLATTFGGRVSVYTRAQTPKNAKKTVYRWTCEGERMTHLCESILPFSLIKKEEIEVVLAMRYSLQRPKIRKGNCGVPELPQETLDYRHYLFLKLKALHNRSYVKQN